MSGYQFLLALRARRGVFAVALLATVAATALVSLLLPKSYKATVSLLVDAKDEQSLGNALRPLLMPHERISYLQTQMDILTSGRVARKVVEDLKLTQHAALRAAFERAANGGSLEDWIGAQLLRDLKVETSQSNVIQATFSARDPVFAAQVANAFARAYIETVLALRVEPTREAAAWFDEQLKSLRASLEQAQKNLTDYHRREGIVSSDERFDVETTRLGALAEEVAKGQQLVLQWDIRAQQARRALDERGALDKLPEVLDNAFIQKLKTDLLHSEAKLRELATQYGGNHPLHQRQVSEIQSLRDKLGSEMRKVVEGTESTARQSRQRQADLEKALEAQRERLLRLKENRNELTVLRRNVESAERAYDTAMQRSVVSRVDSRASQTNVAVLNPAAVPDAPFRPRITLNLALSVLLGGALGTGLVLLLETGDRRLRSAAELEQACDLPLLAALSPWRPAQRMLPGPG